MSLGRGKSAQRWAPTLSGVESSSDRPGRVPAHAEAELTQRFRRNVGYEEQNGPSPKSDERGPVDEEGRAHRCRVPRQLVNPPVLRVHCVVRCTSPLGRQAPGYGGVAAGTPTLAKPDVGHLGAGRRSTRPRAARQLRTRTPGKPLLFPSSKTPFQGSATQARSPLYVQVSHRGHPSDSKLPQKPGCAVHRLTVWLP